MITPQPRDTGDMRKQGKMLPPEICDVANTEFKTMIVRKLVETQDNADRWKK